MPEKPLAYDTIPTARGKVADNLVHIAVWLREQTTLLESDARPDPNHPRLEELRAGADEIERFGEEVRP